LKYTTLGSWYTDCPYTETSSFLIHLPDKFFYRKFGPRGFSIGTVPIPRHLGSNYTVWCLGIQIFYLFVCIASPLFCPYMRTPHLVRILLLDIINSPYTKTPVYIHLTLFPLYTSLIIPNPISLLVKEGAHPWKFFLFNLKDFSFTKSPENLEWKTE